MSVCSMILSSKRPLSIFIAFDSACELGCDVFGTPGRTPAFLRLGVAYHLLSPLLLRLLFSRQTGKAPRRRMVYALLRQDKFVTARGPTFELAFVNTCLPLHQPPSLFLKVP
jgi:hypothetical protein